MRGPSSENQLQFGAEKSVTDTTHPKALSYLWRRVGGQMGLTANNSIKSFFAKLKMEFIYVVSGESHALSNLNGKKNREGGESNTTIRGISHYNLPLGIN